MVRGWGIVQYLQIIYNPVETVPGLKPFPNILSSKRLTIAARHSLSPQIVARYVSVELGVG